MKLGAVLMLKHKKTLFKPRYSSVCVLLLLQPGDVPVSIQLLSIVSQIPRPLSSCVFVIKHKERLELSFITPSVIDFSSKIKTTAYGIAMIVLAPSRLDKNVVRAR